MDLSFEVDMHAHGIGDAPVVVGDTLSFGQFFLDFVVLREIFHDRCLGRFFRPDKVFAVTAGKLCEYFGRDDTQVIVVIEKPSIHIFASLSSMKILPG